MAVVINGQVYENLVQLAAQKDALNLSYWKGDSRIVSVVVPEEVTAIAGDFTIWPNVTEVIVMNKDSVVTGLDTKFANVSGITYWVADDMLTAYETAYPTLAFNTWPNYDTWIIPYLAGETPTTLTAAYVQSELAKNPVASYATKVVVPVYFTAYESGAIQAIIDNFPSLTMFKTCYEKGDIDLDMNGDIVASIDDLNAALVWARSYSSSNNGQVTDLYEYTGHTIYPPLVITRNLFFERTTKNRLISNMIMKTETGSLWLSANQNWLSLQITFEKSQANYANFVFNVPNTLKYIKLNNLDRSANISGSTQFTREALVDLFNSLGTPATQQTLTIGATNLAKLTVEDIAIATSKNWQLA